MRTLLRIAALLVFGSPLGAQLIAPGFFVHKAGALTCAIVFRSNTPYSVQTYCYTFVAGKPHYWHNTIDEVYDTALVSAVWCVPSPNVPIPGCSPVEVTWDIWKDSTGAPQILYQISIFADGKEQPQIVGVLDTVYGQKPAAAKVGMLIGPRCSVFSVGFQPSTTVPYRGPTRTDEPIPPGARMIALAPIGNCVLH